MATNDSAAQTIRFNLVTQLLEYAVDGSWVSAPGFSGGTVSGLTVFTLPPRFPVTTTTGTGTVTPTATTSSQIEITVTGALTLNGPAGGVDGQKIIFRLLQDGTGHAVTFATGAGNFRFSTDIPTFTASGAGLTDYVGVIFNGAANRWDIVSIIQGF